MTVYLADTNVLVRAIQRDDLKMRALARNALKHLYRRGDSVCLFSQNLIELWGVSTRPVNSNGLGLSLPETERYVTRCERVGCTPWLRQKNSAQFTIG